MIIVAAKAETPVRMVTTRAKRVPVPLWGVSDEKLPVDMLRGVRASKLDFSDRGQQADDQQRREGMAGTQVRGLREKGTVKARLTVRGGVYGVEDAAFSPSS